MFIAIANADHDQMLDNCDIEVWNEYWTETENPVFMAMTFKRACEAIKQYYQAIGDDSYPDYTIYEINSGSWTMKGTRTIAIDIERHDA